MVPREIRFSLPVSDKDEVALANEIMSLARKAEKEVGPGSRTTRLALDKFMFGMLDRGGLIEHGKNGRHLRDIEVEPDEWMSTGSVRVRVLVGSPE